LLVETGEILRLLLAGAGVAECQSRRPVSVWAG